ncbi:class I adenylate-forming enzyme family protein [Nocardia sp. BMG51109]|uniref:class I adenylate-forming enzyme family protein n=1 Tax=Nocardia sp. BMG51109 TaxID=1056816 RepID=UPI0004664BF4|nr:class I adenylate-forming enzyme family protein [Nocardia sp. BMG51109]
MSSSVAESCPTVPALLRRCVAEFGGERYVVTPDGELTYAAAERRSAEIARRLLYARVGKGSRVGLFFTSGSEWVVWWLALCRIGAVAVPLSTMYAPGEIRKVLRLADIELLVAADAVLGTETGAILEAALPDLARASAGGLQLPEAPYLREIVLTGEAARGWASRWSSDLTAVSPEVLASVEDEVSPADPAIMIHTSGSTADPKGVVHTHGTLVRQTSTWPAAIRHATGVDGIPRVLCAMPLFWVGGMLAVTGALHEPATLLLLPRLDPGPGLDLMEREKATGVIGWPAFTQRLREHPTFADRDLSSAPLLRDGPLDLAMVGVPGQYPVHRSLTETAGSFAHTDIRIAAPDGSDVPDETVGELLIRGIGVMAGYNKRERSTVFDADGWFHTGDLVYRIPRDPRLFYVGRTSELIKPAGANVSPREVEAVIESFDEVLQCVVVGLDHPTRGEEVCAVVIPAGSDLDLESLTARTRSELSAYKVPTRWVVTTSARLPILPSGKLDRRHLRTLIADGTLK